MDMGSVTDNDIVSVLTIEGRRRQLPTIITRLILGARVITPWRTRQDIVVVEDVYGSTKLSIQDFLIAKDVFEKIVKEFGVQRVVPAHQILAIRDRAQAVMESMTDERAGKKGIIMLKDQGGCGYWRMSLPARYIDRNGIYIDVTGGTLDFNGLLEYDTIFVQRVHNWDSHGVLEKLKAAGKRIVYDIDDDLFAIPAANPASGGMGRSEQMAAVECMKLADVVTTTTPILQERLTQLIGRAPVVVPNAIDPDDGWNPTPLTGSPDGRKRIFWQGSNTHDGDWDECFDAVDRIMAKRSDVRMVILGFLPTMIKEKLEEPHWRGRVEYLGTMAPEAYFRLIKHIRADVGLVPLQCDHFNAVDRIMAKRSDVRMVILGFLPTMIKEKLEEPHWRGRVEYLGTMAPEAYFRLIKHIRADVGLVPLQCDHFNAGKSQIKLVENSVIGIPTVASDVEPYSDVIENGKDGFLCSSAEDWEDAIQKCLNDERLRGKIVENARARVRKEFNIKNTAKTWRNLLIPIQ
jgi:glycosyltransferase involved in cell wall biosynthesis